MIRDDKLRDALRALNAVLVQGRTMAYERADHKDLAEVFDSAELLPMLIAETEDRTSRFRDTLAGLVGRFPGFAWALQRFDGEA